MAAAATSITVRELLIYPIKSCAPIKVDEAQITPYGLALPSNPLLSDRRWMVVQGNRVRDQRHIPRMALIHPSFTPSGLQIDAPGMRTLVIPYNPLPRDIVEIEKLNVKGRRYNKNISNWFCDFLETEGLSLIYFDQEFEPQYVKDVEPQIPNDARDDDAILYHYMSPYHLCSIESTEDLNRRLENPIEVYNFRPNIIVSGLSAPYNEDYWRLIQIGDKAKLRWFRSCLRCLLPTVTQKTGVRDPDQEPWKTLQTYRRKPGLYGSKSAFGTYLATSENGIIRVGDCVRVLLQDGKF